MINKTPFVPSVRFPRAIVQVNDVGIKYLDVRIDTNDFSSADEFTVSVPLNGQPKPFTFGYWGNAAQFLIKIYVGFPTNPQQFTQDELELVFVGEADNCYVDPVAGVVRLVGRDLTSRLIDKKTTRKFSSLTASQLATLLANENGLTPIVTPTTTTLGSFYFLDQTLLSRTETEWDLLNSAATQEGFVVYVEAGNLIFKPKPVIPGNPYVIYYNQPTNTFASPVSNVERITFERDMTLAQDVIVKVRCPYSSMTGNDFTVIATAHNTSRSELKGLPTPSGHKQVYTFIKPGFTKQQALQYAQNVLKNIAQHGIKMYATLPGDPIFKKDTVVQVQGTDSDYDTYYYMSNILRTIRPDGFKMTISTKNSPTNSEVVV